MLSLKQWNERNGQKHASVIAGSRKWPWPEQVASNSPWLPGRLLFVEWLRASRQALTIKEEAQQQLGRVTFGPQQQEDGAWEALLSDLEEPNYKGWM